MLFPYHVALCVAEDLLSEIGPFCLRAEIVGSLRRGRPNVHDIDILAIPTILCISSTDKIGSLLPRNLLELKISRICQDGWCSVEPAPPGHKRLLRRGDEDELTVDLYVGTEESWWTKLLVLTGSRVHNLNLALRAKELGLVLRPDGEGLERQDGSRLPVESEEDIFRALRLPFRPPQWRE